MYDKSRPMTLGDIFSTTFTLFGKTIGRNSILAVVFIVPAGIFMAYGMQYFFSSFIDAIRNIENTGVHNMDPRQMFELGASLTTYVFAILIFSLGQLGALIGITKICYSTMMDEDITYEQAFKKVFSITYLRSIGMYILLFLAFGGIMAAAAIIMAIASIGNIILLKIFGVFVIIGAVLAIIYLIFRWYFNFIAIVGEDKKVLDSFGKSSFLVSGNWWRTFGIIFLISILLQFAVSLISTPISFLVMWDFFSKYFSMIANGSYDRSNQYQLLEMMKSFGFTFGIVTVISTFLETLIFPLFKVVMYVDLKIRKNDMPVIPVEENPLPDGGPVIEQQ